MATDGGGGGVGGVTATIATAKFGPGFEFLQSDRKNWSRVRIFAKGVIFKKKYFTHGVMYFKSSKTGVIFKKLLISGEYE